MQLHFNLLYKFRVVGIEFKSALVIIIIIMYSLATQYFLFIIKKGARL